MRSKSALFIRIILDGEPTLKERVLTFFKDAPKRYSFAPEMDPAAKTWIRKYKKLFDQVAAANAGMNASENVGADNRVLKVIGKVTDDSIGTATKAPDKVIKKIGKIVDDNALESKNNTFGSNINAEPPSDNGLRTKNGNKKTLTNMNDENMQVSGERFAIKKDGKGREYWEINSGKDIFKGLNTPEEYRDSAFAFLISNRDNKVVVKDKFGKEITFIRLSAEEFTQSQESQKLFGTNHTMFSQKMRLIPSLDDILLHYNVNWSSPDHKNHKMFKKNGFENYRGRVRIDNMIFNTIVRVGKANFGDVFYDINLEVDSYLPHASKSASDINESTSNGSISQKSQNDNSFDKNSSKDFNLGERSALADGKKVTSSDVARIKGQISEAGIDPRGIMGVSDSYFDRYNGTLTRTGLRFEFLDAAQMMLDDSEGSFDRAYARIEAIVDELTYNEKESGGFADDLKEIQRHIREITFEIREQDKGEFESLGGFNEFRKKHFGRLKIGNDGSSVDSIYGELQTLYVKKERTNR